MPAASPPRFLLAVEGGGSKTTALLTDLEGKGVGRGFGPGSNPHAVGVERARKALVDQSVRDLARQVDTAIRRLALERPPLALAGSQLPGEVRRGLLTSIASPIGDVADVEDPCRGAVALARRHFKGQKP
jgi:N-acetylglucosamine kinase-like BadF-type ATPase